MKILPTAVTLDADTGFLAIKIETVGNYLFLLMEGDVRVSIRKADGSRANILVEESVVDNAISRMARATSKFGMQYVICMPADIADSIKRTVSQAACLGHTR